VRIPVQGDRRAAVAEAVLDDHDRSPRGDQERGMHVAQVVKAQSVEADGAHSRLTDRQGSNP